MNNKNVKRSNANRKVVKRVGANRQKLINEQRAQRPRAVAAAAQRISKIAAIIALVAAAGYGVFAYSPTVVSGISSASKSSKKLYSNVRITNCGKQTESALRSAIGSLVDVDSSLFVRTEVLKAAAAIPEIEKISVRKVRGRSGKEDATLIKVVERKPVALIHCGGVSLVDKKGIRFAPRPGQFYELPLFIVGSAAAVLDTVDLSIFNQIRKTSRNLGPSFFQQISQIDVSDGSSVSLFFKSGEAEYVMAYEDIEARLPHVKKLRERLLEDSGAPVRIDLRYRSLAFASAR